MPIRPITDNTPIIITADESNAFKIGPKERIVGVATTSATWDAADIGFEVSFDEQTWLRVVDPVRTTAATSHARIINVESGVARFYVVPECLDLQLGASMKLTSIATSSNSPVSQSSPRTVLVYVMQMGGM